MVAQFMVQPSSLMRSGITMSQMGEVYLFKFNEELQSRFEDLQQQKKQQSLTHAEQAELAGISDRNHSHPLAKALPEKRLNSSHNSKRFFTLFTPLKPHN
jgi:hypothetical protein